VLGGGDRGRTDWSPTTGEVHSGSTPGSRFYDDGVVERHRRGLGDHGGRTNLAGGSLGWPVHGEVARGGGDRR
jgi:hypothetical protein